MAEEEKHSKSSSSSSRSEESVKLFVGQVPKHMTESQLLAMFKEFAIVDQVNIIKDKNTRTSRGLLLSNLFFIPFLSLSLYLYLYVDFFFVWVFLGMMFRTLIGGLFFIVQVVAF